MADPIPITTRPIKRRATKLTPDRRTELANTAATILRLGYGRHDAVSVLVTLFETSERQARDLVEQGAVLFTSALTRSALDGSLDTLGIDAVREIRSLVTRARSIAARAA